MSGNHPTACKRRVAWRIAAVIALAAFSMRAPLAQQPAGAGGWAHAAARSGAKAGGGLVIKGVESAPVRVAPAPPPVSSPGTIGGASFTRSGAALLPLGGPAKPAATGINGTSIRPKH